MNNFNNPLDDLFGSFQHTSRYKDSVMMEIMMRRQEFESSLDKMWSNMAFGGMKQVAEYRKGVDQIKDAGLVVLRNSAGKHKIAYKK